MRGQLRKDVGGAAQAGQQQQGVSVAVPVQEVEPDAVEDDELVGRYVEGSEHPVSVRRRVDDVADEFVPQLAEEAELKAREPDRSKLRIAAHWAERHQVDDVLKAAHWSDADLRDVCEAIGGEGTPLVHEAAVAPLLVATSR